MTPTATQDGMLELIRTWLADSREVISLVEGRHILLKHPDHIRAVLTDGTFGKDTRVNEYFREHVADGVLTAPPARHRGERLVLSAAARDPRTLERVTHAHVQALAAQLDKFADQGQRVDLTATMNRLSLGIIAEVLFGWTEIDELAAAMAAATGALDTSAAMLPSPEQLAAVRARVFRVVGELIDAATAPGPAITAMSEADFPREGIVHQVVTMLLAGHETTANSLAWTWISLIRTPAEYSRWQQQMLATPALARASTVNITREGLRLYPSSWVIGRRAGIDREIDGVTIPRGCTISISPFLTHRHPQFWPNPDTFDPARHDQVIHRHAWLPFGAGHRMCLGAAYALREADIVLSMLGQQFRFHSEDAATAAPRFRYTLGAPPLQVEIQPLGRR